MFRMKRALKVIGMSVASGWFYTFLVDLCGLVHDPFVYSGGPIPMDIATIVVISTVFGAIYGIPIGLLCSLVSVMCLRRKDLARVAKIMFVVLCPLAVALVLLDPPTPSGQRVPNPYPQGFWLLAAFVPAFCLTSLFLWRYLPNESERQSTTCLLCGYDLTGNVSGVCPECGMRIEG